MSTLSDLITQDDNAEINEPERMEEDNQVENPPEDEEILMETPYDEASYGPNGKDPLPATTLMICVDKLYQSFNNLVTDYFPSSTYIMPQPTDIKETADFDVRMFKDACNELANEFTKTAAEWKLACPGEAHAEECKNLEKAVKRQEEVKTRINGKLKIEGQKIKR
uniref:Mediator of RNA polymerase II transcription subunit 7 n=1 Tax=Panagrolaimus sp. JU765 TaxID=591449 RepID=A0AC34QN65_9BILA